MAQEARRIADMQSMDVLGASVLAARIRAGVRIGQMIELLRDSSTSPDLKRGDLGFVAGFSANGNILVRWSGGSALESSTLPPTRTRQSCLGWPTAPDQPRRRAFGQSRAS